MLLFSPIVRAPQEFSIRSLSGDVTILRMREGSTVGALTKAYAKQIGLPDSCIEMVKGTEKLHPMQVLDNETDLTAIINKLMSIDGYFENPEFNIQIVVTRDTALRITTELILYLDHDNRRLKIKSSVPYYNKDTYFDYSYQVRRLASMIYTDFF